MDAFSDKVHGLRDGFSILNIEEKENALGMLETLVEECSQTLLREKVQMEAELTIADHAGRIILERFADDFITFESNLQGSSWQYNDDYLMNFEVPPGESGHKLSGKTSTNDSEKNSFHNSVYNDAPMEVVAQDFEMPSTSEFCSLNLTLPSENGNHLNTRQNQNSDHDVLAPSNSTDYICATCNFVATNRKALYRHGLKESHTTRQSIEKSGQFKCALCDFVTNKKFNYDRHLQRTHFVLRNHVCHHCDARFKDNDTLKGHLKTVHSELRSNQQFFNSM